MLVYIDIQKKEGVIKNNEIDYEYVPHCRVSAEIRPISGKDQPLPGDVQQAVATHKIRVRDKAIQGLSYDMRVMYEGHILEIMYYYPAYNRRGWIDLHCKEVLE